MELSQRAHAPGRSRRAATSALAPLAASQMVRIEDLPLRLPPLIAETVAAEGRRRWRAALEIATVAGEQPAASIADLIKLDERGRCIGPLPPHPISTPPLRRDRGRAARGQRQAGDRDRAHAPAGRRARSFAVAYLVIAVRLVTVTLLSDGDASRACAESRRASRSRSSAARSSTATASCWPRTWQTWSLYANPQQIMRRRRGGRAPDRAVSRTSARSPCASKLHQRAFVRMAEARPHAAASNMP